MRLSDEQIELYSRQIILREIGGTGQAALRTGRVRLIGTGAAADACTSYLVGAGIGVVDVDADAARALPLPRPGRRTADATVAEIAVPLPPTHPVRSYDVVLDLDDASTAHAASPDAKMVRPRLGTLLLRSDARGTLHLVLLPDGTGCTACTRSDRDLASTRRHVRASPIASASAGALAALGCCRWLLGIGADAAARTLTLSPGSSVWRDGAPPLRVACPNGCPPPAQPV